MNKLRAIFCVLFGHSNIVTQCFGYVHCARCGECVGDALGGGWSNPNAVVVGHNCDTCRQNYKKLTWKDRLFCPNPFEG